MFILVSKYFVAKRFTGITLWPFIIVKNRTSIEDAVFMNHEKIHCRQQQELLLLLFYVWYVLEFLVRWRQYGTIDLAYRNISFEKEAYAKEDDLRYLKERKFCSFLKYI